MRRKKIRLGFCHVCVDVCVLGGIIVSRRLPTFDGFSKAALLYLWRLSPWRQLLASAAALRDKPAEKKQERGEISNRAQLYSSPANPSNHRGEGGKVQMKENLHVAIPRSPKTNRPKNVQRRRQESWRGDEEEETEQNERWKKDLSGTPAKSNYWWSELVTTWFRWLIGR